MPSDIPPPSEYAPDLAHCVIRKAGGAVIREIETASFASLDVLA